jgi:hypothetical protein
MLQTQLEEERKQHEELEVRMLSEQMVRLADQQRMAEMFQYMQCLGATSAFAPPPPLFRADEPTQFCTHVSMKILVM